MPLKPNSSPPWDRTKAKPKVPSLEATEAQLARYPARKAEAAAAPQRQRALGAHTRPLPAPGIVPR